VVPAYNAEKYLSRCLSTCMDQDLNRDEFEVLVVNDGSTDNTLQIISKYSTEFDNIKVICKKNEGLGEARNDGLEAASGEYIWFVDSDDWITTKCLHYVYSILSKNDLDALWFQLVRINENGEVIPLKKLCRKCLTEVLTGEQFLKQVMGYEAYAVLFVFKRYFLLKSNLRFKKGIYYEDAEFIPRALLAAQRVKYEPVVLYNYFLRSGSIIQSYNPKRVDDLIFVIRSMKNSIEKNKMSHDVLYLNAFSSVLIINTIKLTSNPKYKEKQKEMIMNLTEVRFTNTKVLCEWILRPSEWILILEACLINISAVLFLKICIVVRSLKKHLLI